MYICTDIYSWLKPVEPSNYPTVEVCFLFLDWTALFIFLAMKQQQFLAKATSMSFGPLWPGQEATSHLSQGPVRGQTWKDHAMAAMDQKCLWNPVVVLMHNQHLRIFATSRLCHKLR